MTSIPVMAADMTLSGLLPDIAPPAYYYTNAYQPVNAGDPLTPGVGYWTYFNEPHTYQVCGTIVGNKDITVNDGWNMIGPFDTLVTVSAITSTPAGILSPPLYGYGTAYEETTTIVPGEGYWVYATQAGTLHLADP
jgi:hypothetical protein